MQNRLIAVLTDFGVEEHYNGVMKGVIYGINPEARIVDLVSSAKSFSVLDAAFQLWASYKYFPEETVFLVVVDPGVGTQRQPIAIKTSKYFFVGPDNGVLYPAAYSDGIESAVRIESKDVILPGRTGTFDGRDVFAPAAAYLSKGYEIDRLGPRTEMNVKYAFPEPSFAENLIEAIVLHVDRFGDVVLNIPSSYRIRSDRLRIKNRMIAISRSFEECPDICMIPGSSGFYELAKYMKSAAEELGLRPGDNVLIELG
ncbi:MAG: SAM hydrolase/SAM-dependent halogenase family protein [Nitrososphaeria archaeon]